MDSKPINDHPLQQAQESTNNKERNIEAPWFCLINGLHPEIVPVVCVEFVFYFLCGHDFNAAGSAAFDDDFHSVAFALQVVLIN